MKNPLLLGKKCVRNAGDGSLNRFCHETQLRHNHTGDALTLTEAYLEGRGHLRLLFAWPHSPSLSSVASKGLTKDRLSNRHGGNDAPLPCEFLATQQCIQCFSVEDGDASGSQNKVVLIAQVEEVDAIKRIIPTRVRFERVYRSDDVFSGDLYLSIRNGATQPLCRAGKGEKNSLWFWSAITNHTVGEEIKGGFEIVNGIPDNQGEVVWDGFLGFDDKGTLGTLWINFVHQDKRCTGDECFNFPMQIVDVMFGPLNLLERASD